jgi:single-stranded DNA-binding protein
MYNNFTSFFFAGGPNSNLNSSQMVRQGLRAVVSGRTQQSNVGNGGNSNIANNNIRRNLASPLDQMGPNSGSGGALVDSNSNNNNPNNNLLINQPQQPQLPGNMMSTSSELDSTMRFNFDMSQG